MAPIGLSWTPAVRRGSPTVFTNVLVPAAIRPMMIRDGPKFGGSGSWSLRDRPPYQMFPLSSAMEKGSQQRSSSCEAALPGMSAVGGIGRSVNAAPPFVETHALYVPGGPPFAPTSTR